MPPPPAGTVAFLFTDIEGSTRRWERAGPAMAVALARHDRILRGAIEGHGGHVFKTVGDAFCAAFARADGALAAAVAGQRALAAEPWDADLGPLRVRMALHAGAAEERGGDYFGPAVNRVARLLAAGHGGQVLLSRAAEQLVRDGLPGDVSLRDLGEHRLKDLERPEQVFQVIAAVLADDLPPLATLDRQAHNLQVQPTPFLGREGELARLVEFLRSDEVRLVTLTGPGGTGKTRLAVQVAAELVEAFPDGVWFVAFAPLTDPALVPSAIAQVLGVREEARQLLTARVADHLRDKRLLLVLDNLEQLLPAAASTVGDLIGAAPGLTVLATSRGPLRLRAEREVPVPPLGLPRRKPPPSMDQLGQYDAVRLFIERAQAVRPDFAVTNGNAPAVAEICHRLDGLPLAIELAAARIKMFPAEAMLRRLEVRLPLLTGGARDLPVRQQTLRGAIAWSYELLAPDEQSLFRRLAVFANGATLEAIGDVVAADELGLDVVDGLERLVDQGLLRQTEAAGEPRFGMLETIREFGGEQLATSGEADEAHRRQATYFLALAEKAEPTIRDGSGAGPWLDRLEAEHDNLRVALRWALAHEPETALRLGAAIGNFWARRGHLSEGRTWLDQVLAMAPLIRSRVRAQILNHAGNLAFRQGDFGRAAAWAEEVLATGRELDDPMLLLAGLNNLGNASALSGDLARAAELYEEELAVARKVGNSRNVAIALELVGIVAASQGDLDRATALIEESLEIGNERNDPNAMIYNLANLGQLALARRAWADAAERLQDALRLAAAVGLQEGIVAEALIGLGIVAGAADRHDRAARLMGAADALVARLGTFLDPVLPQAFARARAATPEALGPDTFAAHHAAGAALLLEEAVAEALALAEDLADEHGVPRP